MIESWRARPAALAGHADAAAHDLKGDALHEMRGAEGMLLAGAARYAGQREAAELRAGRFASLVQRSHLRRRRQDKRGNHKAV